MGSEWLNSFLVMIVLRVRILFGLCRRIVVGVCLLRISFSSMLLLV